MAVGSGNTRQGGHELDVTGYVRQKKARHGGWRRQVQAVAPMETTSNLMRNKKNEAKWYLGLGNQWHGW